MFFFLRVQIESISVSGDEEKANAGWGSGLRLVLSLTVYPGPQLPQLSNGGRFRCCSALTFWAPTLHEERRIVEREKQEEEADRTWKPDVTGENLVGF